MEHHLPPLVVAYHYSLTVAGEILVVVTDDSHSYELVIGMLVVHRLVAVERKPFEIAAVAIGTVAVAHRLLAVVVRMNSLAVDQSWPVVDKMNRTSLERIRKEDLSQADQKTNEEQTISILITSTYKVTRLLHQIMSRCLLVKFHQIDCSQQRRSLINTKKMGKRGGNPTGSICVIWNVHILLRCW